MSALEFAIANVFRHFFFGLRLAVTWAIIASPVAAAVWFSAFHGALPDLAVPSPRAIGGLAVLGTMLLLASFSIAVNWHRRIILNEKPCWLGWVRLNGVVWRYLFCFLFIAAVVGAAAAGVFAVQTYAVPALEPQLAAAAKPVGIGISVLLGLFGLFTWYRLSTLLPAIATGDKDYSIDTAWKATRNNRARFLGFTFWLLFSLAIAGGVGVGAFLAQKALNNPYATAAAFAIMGLLVWLALFFITTIAASHYAHFSQHGDKAK